MELTFYMYQQMLYLLRLFYEFHLHFLCLTPSFVVIFLPWDIIYDI